MNKRDAEMPFLVILKEKIRVFFLFLNIFINFAGRLSINAYAGLINCTL